MYLYCIIIIWLVDFGEVMRLSDEAKKKLLLGVGKTYEAYLALDCTESCKIFDGQSFVDFTGKMRTANELKKQVKVGETDYTICIQNLENGSYSINIQPQNQHELMTCKDLKDPDEKKIVALLASQSIEIDPTQPHPYVTIYNDDRTASIRIGGDKLQLYHTHLNTLYNIYERIMAGDDISNLLVALATGSGKTFVQALWLVSLHIAGMKGFFGVPGRLENQFFDDLRRLLPKEFVDEKIGRLGDPKSDAGFLGQEKDIVVGNAFAALDDHFEQLDKCDPNEVMLSFDEQHLLMRVERRRLRLIDISERFLSCFLTATPNEETYNLCGKTPIATMSNKQKQEAGQGKIPKLVTITAKSASDKNANTRGFFNRLARGFNIFLSDAIQKQPTSAAIQVLDELPFMTQEVDGKKQKPVQRKMLFIVDDPDSLINICHRVNNPNSRKVYENGNLYSREEIGKLLQIQDVDATLYEEEMEARGQNAIATQAIDGHLKSIIFHNMIDYILTTALNMSLIDLNRLRQENPKLLLIYAKLKFGKKGLNLSESEKRELNQHPFNLKDTKDVSCANLSQSAFQLLLKEKIDDEGAQEISRILAGIAETLQLKLKSEIVSTFDKDKYLQNDPDDDEYLYSLLSNAKDCFEEYAQNHLVLCVMDDMRSKDLPIEHDIEGKPKPFWGMIEDTYALYDENGMKSQKAKSRPLKSIEALNPHVQETRFSPNYAPITEAQADNYFKLGFVGAYISNRKTEGFNDLNLHTVVSVCNDGGQRLNGPDKLLQGLGRNRGLDETIEPLFIHAIGHGQLSPFDLKNLDKEDYYKEYFQGMRTFRDAYLKLLGNKLAKDIIEEYYAGVEPDGHFDTEVFRKKIMHMIREDLREINSLNNHEIKISRVQLRKVLTQAQKCLNEHLNNIKKPNRLSGFISFLGHLMNAVASIIFWFGQRGPQAELNAVKQEELNEHDKIYKKILSKTSFKQLSKKLFVSSEIKSLLNNQLDLIPALIKKNPKTYLKDELKTQTEQYENTTIKPLLLKFVKEEHQKSAKSALDKHPDLLGFLHRNEQLLKKLNSDDLRETEVKKLLVEIFQQFDETKTWDESYFIDAIQLVKELKTKIHLGACELLTLEVCTQISEGLTPEFINNIKINMSPLLMPDDVEKLENGLTTEVGQEFFKKILIGHRQFLRDETDGIDISDANILFDLFNQALGENAIQHPAQLLEGYTQSMSQLQQDLHNSPVQAMNEESFSELKNHFKESLIPAMINLCPLEDRPGIIKGITDEAIDAFILNNLLTLQKMQKEQKSPEEIANFVLSSLTKSDIRSAQSPEIVQEQVQQSLKSVFTKWRDTSLSQLATNFFVGAAVLFGGAVSYMTEGKGKGKGLIESTQAEYLSYMVSDEVFLNAFSSLVPHEQYTTLRKKLSNNSSLSKNIAYQLMTLDQDSIDGTSLVAAVSRGSDIPMEFIAHKAKNAEEKISKMFAKKDTNPSALLKIETIEQLSSPTQKTLIPLLSKFIKDDELRTNFIAHCQTIGSAQLFDFMVLNEEKFKELESQSEDFEGMKQPLIEIFNGLNALGDPNSQLPDFTAEQLRDSKELIDERTSSLKDLIELETISQYLITTDFIDVLQLAYNQEDLEMIREVLRDPSIRTRIAKKLKNSADVPENFDVLFKAFAPNVLQHVLQLDSRLNQFEEFLGDLAPEKEPLKHLDKDQVNNLIQEQLLVPLIHRLIKEEFLLTIGLFDEQELETLLSAMYERDPPIDAKKLIIFCDLLKNNKLDEIKDQFLLKEYDNFDDLPLTKVFEVTFNIHKEMIKCHCQFNQHGMRGERVCEENPQDIPGYVECNNIQPEIFSKLSSNIKNISMNRDSAILSMSRRLFYLRSLQQGFPETNELHERNHAAEIKHIQRIKEHILEPIRVRVGTPLFRKVLDPVISGFKFAFGKLSDLLNGMFTKTDDKDQNNEWALKRTQDRKEAIEFVSTMNILKELPKEEAKQPKSVMEAVDTLLPSPENPSKTLQLPTPELRRRFIFSSSKTLRQKIKGNENNEEQETSSSENLNQTTKP